LTIIFWPEAYREEMCKTPCFFIVLFHCVYGSVTHEQSSGIK